MACAVVLWLLRIRIDARTTMLLHWVAVALAAVVVVWLIYTALSAAWSRPPAAGREPLPMAFIRCIFGVQIFSVAIFGCLAYWLRANRPSPGVVGHLRGTRRDFSFCGRERFEIQRVDGIPAEIEKFRDWRRCNPA